MPDGGFFPQPASKRRKAEPPILQNPERGVVEIKPADYDLDALTNEPQTLRYLTQYGLVLITNLREFRLLQLTPALHSEEAAYFAQVVRRIAAILLLGPALDASYRAIIPTATGVPTP